MILLFIPLMAATWAFIDINLYSEDPGHEVRDTLLHTLVIMTVWLSGMYVGVLISG
jgi:hypothetical protein